MPRSRDSQRLDLAAAFHKVQQEMQAHLATGKVFEHATAAGNATEQRWIDFFTRYLPKRYRAAPAFIIDAKGNRSRQIDIAIFDNLYSPLLFPHDSGIHIPAESVYAVFEIKPTLTRQWIRDAGEKAASVRALHRTSIPVQSAGTRRDPIKPQPVIAGILTIDSVWTEPTFQKRLHQSLVAAPPQHHLDLGCALQDGAFEHTSGTTKVSTPNESLIFFLLRLLDRLQTQGTAPAADLMQYGRYLESFKD